MKREKRGTQETVLRFSGERRVQRRRRWRRAGGRALIWLAAVAGLVLVVAGLLWGARQTLFVQNDFFVVRQVQIRVFGNLKESVVLAEVKAFGVDPGVSNLFAVDLGELREHLTDHVLINRAVASRHLPDELWIEVYERRPVAQLLAPRGKLLDSRGLVLPVRSDMRTLLLPIITGVRNAGTLTVGSVSPDPLVAASLRLLQLKGTESYGKYLDINLIQLDYAQDTLKVFVRKQPPFREGACIILPADERLMVDALRRVEVIVRQRRQGRQTASFIDATYEINVPIRP